jgi:hypothetical protein
VARQIDEQADFIRISVQLPDTNVSERTIATLTHVTRQNVGDPRAMLL